MGPALPALAENQWFDRKSARISAKDLADALIGFANADGGTVVVGRWNGAIEGTDADERRRNALMQAAVDFSVPPVSAASRLLPCETDSGPDHLLVFEIRPGEGVVHTNRKDEAFLRVGGNPQVVLLSAPGASVRQRTGFVRV